jgi:hypothetical protein
MMNAGPQAALAAEGLISELMSESNDLDRDAGGVVNVRDNLKAMLVQMQQQQLISSFNSSMISPLTRQQSDRY